MEANKADTFQIDKFQKVAFGGARRGVREGLASASRIGWWKEDESWDARRAGGG